MGALWVAKDLVSSGGKPGLVRLCGCAGLSESSLMHMPLDTRSYFHCNCKFLLKMCLTKAYVGVCVHVFMCENKKYCLSGDFCLSFLNVGNACQEIVSSLCCVEV